MPRPKKKAPTHSSGKYVIKKKVGQKADGSPIRKAFYSDISVDDCLKQFETWKIESEVSKRTGEVFIQKEYTFSQWATKWLLTYKKPNVSENTYLFTYENTVTKHLIPFFSGAKLADIKNVDIQSFFAKKTNYSESVLSKMRMCLLGIFETAIDNELCYKNPVKNIKIKSTAKKNDKTVYTTKQIEAIENIAFGQLNEVIILLETGLRRGELLGLMWSDIDFKSGILSVKRSIADSKIQRFKINPPKWNSYRDIPLTQKAVKTFKMLIRTSEYVFTNNNGEIYSPDLWSKKLKTFMQKLKDDIPQLTAHELRHTFGTELRRKGVDIYTIQKVMGHKDIKMTSELYVHNETNELKKAMKV